MSVPLELQPRRSPEPGRPFVNRDRELDIIKDKLKTGVQGKRMPSVVTCFWGAFGMGKSWLLIELEDKYKRSDLQADGIPDGDSHPAVVARLDLSRAVLPSLWKDERLDRVRLIGELWRQLAEQFRTKPPELKRASAEEWADRFVHEVTARSARSSTPLIMLDTVDDLLELDEATFFWLEEHLVERLAITDRVLFVFTSRGELRRWKLFQVRRRVDSRRLTAFDPKTAGKEVKASHAMSEALYRHAFGHPLVTDYLGTALEKQGISPKETKGVESLIEPSSVQEILREVVDEILRGLPESLESLSRSVSALRWVGVEPLRYLAENLDLVESGKGDAYYLDELVGGLQAHHLLYWNSDKNSYEPDPTLRLLLTHFWELDQPEQFFEANRVAFEFHDRHLQQYPAYLARYVPELAYHRAILARGKQQESLPSLPDWWQRFLDEKAPPGVEPWKELVQALEKDTELKGVAPKDYEWLLRRAEQGPDKVAD